MWFGNVTCQVENDTFPLKVTLRIISPTDGGSKFKDNDILSYFKAYLSRHYEIELMKIDGVARKNGTVLLTRYNKEINYIEEIKTPMILLTFRVKSKCGIDEQESSSSVEVDEQVLPVPFCKDLISSACFQLRLYGVTECFKAAIPPGLIGEYATVYLDLCGQGFDKKSLKAVMDRCRADYFEKAQGSNDAISIHSTVKKIWCDIQQKSIDKVKEKENRMIEKSFNEYIESCQEFNEKYKEGLRHLKASLMRAVYAPSSVSLYREPGNVRKQTISSTEKASRKSSQRSNRTESRADRLRLNESDIELINQCIGEVKIELARLSDDTVVSLAVLTNRFINSNKNGEVATIMRPSYNNICKKAWNHLGKKDKLSANVHHRSINMAARLSNRLENSFRGALDVFSRLRNCEKSAVLKMCFSGGQRPLRRDASRSNLQSLLFPEGQKKDALFPTECCQNSC